MTASRNPTPRRRLKRFEALLLIGVALVIYITLSLSLTLSARLGVMREARDNIQWNISQLEVDYLKLEDAAETLREAPNTENLETLRRRFDLFYSRVHFMNNSTALADLHADPDLHRHHAILMAFLDDVAPLIDGTDAAAIAAIEPITGAIKDIARLPRKLVISEVRRAASLTSLEREEIMRLFRTVGLVSVLVAGSLVVGFVILVLQNRALIARKALVATLGDRTLSILRASLDAVVVIDEDGAVTEFNGSAEKIFGYSRSAVFGTRAETLIISPDFLTAHRDSMRLFREEPDGETLHTGRLEFIARHANGSEFPVEMSMSTIGTEEGLLFVAYVRDITEELQRREALQAARDQALCAYEQKSNFFAVMSHEMRTPLNGIISSLELLRDSPLSREQDRLIKIVETSSEILLRHADDVLDIERIEAGSQPVALEHIDIMSLVEPLVAGLQPHAGKQCTDLSTEYEGDVGCMLEIDRRSLQQVLLNLLGNAIKFTANGVVMTRISVAALNPGQAVLSCEVSDTGIGISAADQKRIFEDFVTLGAAYERNFTGTGLGLGIARRLIDRLGGTLSCESVPGEGSSFTFELDVPIIARSAPRHVPDIEPSQPARSLDILVVEDNEINRELIEEILERAGHRPHLATCAREGIAAAEADLYDVILMDISMPDMNGIRATETIRAGEGLSRRTPIIAITAHALPEERARFEAAGMEGCLIKPVRRAALAECFERVIRERPESEARAAAELPELARPEGPRDSEGVSPDDMAFGAPLVDRDQLDCLVSALSQHRLSEMIGTFTTESERLIASFAETGKSEMPRLQKQVHNLSGSSAVFGASALHHQLIRMEDACKAGESERLAALAADLAPLWSRTAAAIGTVTLGE
ncbi:hybrid sensor histidine kinase/response regulator [Profundibacterium mesophilum]|uniref:histidine kinase n=1 Tax=Profundibacterium mesophilum KAUST100406-0324 TaxID=1037889 RepID=A0A921TBS5_9RHOB|nr:ATP-binding protein [Profundibacterium mesophilum]KAF0676155.1 Sensor histidine kinase AruS [Profundibacterium mesophilum KAUST100406-0324]